MNKGAMSISQAGELDRALASAGWGSGLIHKLLNRSLLRRLRAFAQVNDHLDLAIAPKIDSTKNPHAFSMLSLLDHDRIGFGVGRLVLEDVIFFSPPDDVGEVSVARRYATRPKKQVPLNATVRDFVLFHQHSLIPDCWHSGKMENVKRIYFFGTSFRDRHDSEVVPYMELKRNHRGEVQSWVWGHSSLKDKWLEGYYAALKP